MGMEMAYLKHATQSDRYATYMPSVDMYIEFSVWYRATERTIC